MSVSATRRKGDYARLLDFSRSYPHLVEILRVEGNPPTGYVVRFHCRGMEALDGDSPTFRSTHDIAIRFPDGYPLKKPIVNILTPVCNPHVFANGVVCLGYQWSASESLDIFVLRLRSILIWDPIILDPGSAANGDAMDWANSHPESLPLDNSETSLGSQQRPRISWR